MPDRITHLATHDQVVVTGFAGFVSWLLEYVYIDIEIICAAGDKNV